MAHSAFFVCVSLSHCPSMVSRVVLARMLEGTLLNVTRHKNYEFPFNCGLLLK